MSYANLLSVTDVRSAALGDSEAYSRVVDSCRNVVCSLALATVRDSSVSEEVAQEVFVDAWKGLRSLRNPESFLPWLRQLTRRRSADYLRQRARTDGRYLDRSADDEQLAQAVDPAASPFMQLSNEQTRRALADAIDQLPEESREVVILFYREGQSVEQVAKLLDMRGSAVRKRLSRAREKLRESLLEKTGALLAATLPPPMFAAGVLKSIASGAGVSATAGASKALALIPLANLTSIVLGPVISAAALGAALGLGGWAIVRRADPSRERGRFVALFLAAGLFAVCLILAGGVAATSLWAGSLPLVARPMFLVGSNAAAYVLVVASLRLLQGKVAAGAVAKMRGVDWAGVIIGLVVPLVVTYVRLLDTLK